MDFAAQERRTARRHTRAQENGETCVQCHYGLVHKLPDNADALIDAVFSE